MKLELEMQELEQVWYGLDGSAKLLDELAKVLDKHQKTEKKPGREAAETPMTRWRNSSSSARSLAASGLEAPPTQWLAR